VTTFAPAAWGPAGDAPPPAKGERRRPLGDTRCQFLGVALELMAEKGYAATPLREIAARLGLTKAALYYHFPSKDDLLAALVEPAMAELRRLARSAPPSAAEECRRAALEGYVQLVAAHVDLIRVLSQDPSARRSPALAPAAALYHELAALLAGTSEPDTAQRTAVRAALGGIHAAVLQAAPDDDPGVVNRAAHLAAARALGLDEGTSAPPTEEASHE
jgi:AcrR family transcriptional regulator